MPASLIPTPAYRDVRRAVDFLVEAFAFTVHALHEAEDGSVAHVELVLGDSMVMPATPDDGEYGRLLAGVDAVGRPTGGLYVIVDDVDAHAARARAAGAEILVEPRDEDYGGRDYVCRDHEGHVWTFGSYDPWSQSG